MIAYRESIEALVARRDELRALRRREVDSVPRAPRIFRYRVARATFGATLVLGFVAMTIAVAASAATSNWRGLAFDRRNQLSEIVLLAAWPLAILASIAAYGIA